MTYFADLTPYTYDETSQDRLNVGWLDAEHSYSTGDTSDEFSAALVHLLRFQVNSTRGAHACAFCGRKLIDFDDNKGTSCLLGAGEIHVDGADGSAFAAPSLIVHYVLEHRYLPPEAFRKAAVEYARFYGLRALE